MLAVFLVVAGASLLVLVVMAVALVRHVGGLAASLRRFRGEVDPVLREIRADAERARDRMERAAAEAERARDIRRRR